MTVVEIKRTLDGRRMAYTCAACYLHPAQRAVLFYVSAGGWTHHDPEIRVPPGSLTFAYFWSDRPYNVYHWVQPEGQTVGYYFNLATKTDIRPTEVEWEDLAVDYWLSPEGNGAFLDEAELPDDLDPTIVAAIQLTKVHLTTKAVAIASEVGQETKRWLQRRRHRLASSPDAQR